MSRRRTLGTVTSSELNTRSIGRDRRSAIPRKSYGGRVGSSRKSVGAARRQSSLGRPSGGKRRPSTGRQAIGGRASGVDFGRVSSTRGRRNSAYGTKAISQKQDPRPVTNKAYIMEEIELVIEYLTSKHYDRPLSVKVLQSPTQRDFVSIFMFLYHQLDPAYEFGPKPESEAPIIFKRLHYPFQMNKSSLAAVASPHHWPYYLAALAWLVNLLMFVEEAAVMTPSSDDFDGDDGGEKIFFEYLYRAYQTFLAGNDDFEDLEEEIASTFEEKNRDVIETTQRLEREVDGLRNQLDALRGAPSPLAVLAEKHQNIAADSHKFREFVRDLEKLVGRLDRKLDALRAEAGKQDAELAEVEAEKARLEAVIAVQEVHPQDVERMHKELAELEAQRAALADQKEAMDAAVWEQEMQVSRALDDLEGLVAAFNEAMPAQADGTRPVLTVAAHESDPAKILSEDLTGAIQPSLHAIKADYVRRGRAVQGSLIEERERLDRNAEALADRRQGMEAVEARIRKLERQYADEKEGMLEKLRKTGAATEAAEEAIVKLKQANSVALAESEAEVELLERELAEARSNAEAEQESFKETILFTLDMLTRQKTQVQEQLETLYLHCKAIHDDIAASDVADGAAAAEPSE